MSQVFSIGSITTGYRPVKSGREYNHLFPAPTNDDKVIIQDGEVEDTVDLMKKVVWRYIADTKQIAAKLQAQTLKNTCENIWTFLYHHIQYKLDQRGLEQLRRPARSWVERASGIDCDCFSIFISSILTNLKIPHSFRITKYDGPNFQHVYVVVPNQGELIIIDPVLSRFNYEKPYSNKKDIPMNLSGIDVAVLSGLDGDLENVLFGLDLDGALGSASEENQLEAMYRYLVSTRNTIAQHPEMIQHSEDPESFLKMLDYAIEYWHTDKREEALSILAMNEIDFNQKMGFSGDEGLGSFKNFFQKVGKAVKATTQKVGAAVKQAAKAVVKYNPLVAAARMGLLMAMKLNLKKMGSKLKWAYGSQANAASHGISATNYQKAKSALKRVEDLYVKKIQGDPKALKDAILKGRAGGLNGYLDQGAGDLGQLGEPISITAALAAATPVIVATIKIMKDTGLFAKGEDTSTHNLVAEATAENAKKVRNSAPAPSISPNISNEPSLTPSIPGINPSYPPATDPYLLPGSTSPDGSLSPDITSSGDEGSSVSNFIKNNPAVVAVGVGAVAVGGYLLFKPKKAKRKPSLSGVKNSRQTSRQSGRKPKANSTKIPRVTIK